MPSRPPSCCPTSVAPSAAVVVDENDKGVVVQLLDLAVVAKAKGAAKAGDSVTVRVDVADVSTGTITLSVV